MQHEPGPQMVNRSQMVNAPDIVVGADIGGTSTRVAVADLSGRVLGLARGGPGNPNAVGLAASVEQIKTTTQQALDQVRPAERGEVVAAVFGLAGVTRISAPEEFLSTVLPPQVMCRPRLVSDFAVAFASGTPGRDGYVLIAGTGAGATRIGDDQMIDRRDGWGWLLGDEGSGFWLGRAAVRSTLRSLERRQDPGPLGRRVLARAGVSDENEDRLSALISACFAQPPIWLAGFAELVSETHDEDPRAAAIAAEAARLLADTVQSLDLEAGLPIVLGGSVLTHFSRIGDVVTETLAARLGTPATNAVSRATEGVLGALWIAARDIVGDDRSVHATLLNDAPSRG